MLASGDPALSISYLGVGLGWFVLAALVLAKKRSRRAIFALIASVIVGLGITYVMGAIPYAGNEAVAEVGPWLCLAAAVLVNRFALSRWPSGG